jgi:hypothetical protein
MEQSITLPSAIWGFMGVILGVVVKSIFDYLIERKKARNEINRQIWEVKTDTCEKIMEIAYRLEQENNKFCKQSLDSLQSIMPHVHLYCSEDTQNAYYDLIKSISENSKADTYNIVKILRKDIRDIRLPK